MEDSYATLPGISSYAAPTATRSVAVMPTSSYMSGGYGYGGGPQYIGSVTTSSVPATYSMAPAATSMPPAQSPVPGAVYSGSVTNPATGGIIDRYVIPQRAAVPVRSVVPEVETFNVSKQVMVPETHEIQVPVQRMVPEQHTIMVPRTKMVPVQEMVPQTVTRMVPQTFTTTQQVQTTKPVIVQQPMQRTIQKIVEGQKIIETSKVIEYERERIVPGRIRGAAQTQAREVGLQWTNSYYSGASAPTPAGQSVTTMAQPTVSLSRQMPVSYTQPVMSQPIVTASQPALAYAAPAMSYGTYGGAAYGSAYGAMPTMTYASPAFAGQAYTASSAAKYSNDADFEGFGGNEAGTII